MRAGAPHTWVWPVQVHTDGHTVAVLFWVLFWSAAGSMSTSANYAATAVSLTVMLDMAVRWDPPPLGET